MSSLEGNISGQQNLTGEASVLVGLTPNIQVGTTETLDPNTPATVELDESSTKLNPILNFGIPKGDNYTLTEEDRQEIIGVIKEDTQPFLDAIDTAETSRKEAENTRNENETTRQENETTRNTNETTRVEAEETRVANENTRILNEEIRQEKFRMIDNALKDITVEGSNIHIKDSADWFAKVGVFGKSEQETREGYNLCPTDVSYWEIGQYTADTGIKSVYGSGVHSARARLIDLLKVNAGDEIYFNTFADTYSFVVRCYDENQIFISSKGVITNGSTIILDDESAYLSITLFNHTSEPSNEGQTILDKIQSGEIKPFICLSSNASKGFEPYGAMPSFPFPSPVKSVTGDIENKFCNKQLFDFDDFVAKVKKNYGDVVSGTSDDFTIKRNKNDVIKYTFKDIIENTSYYIGYDWSTVKGNGEVRVYYTDGTSTIVNSDYTGKDSSGSMKFTTDSSKTLSAFSVSVFSSTTSFTLKNFIISREETDYTPHQSQTAVFPLAEGQKMYKGSYLSDDGTHHKRKQTIVNGISATFEDAKENGKYMCSHKMAGNLEGKTITFDAEVTEVTVEYELAEEIIEPYTDEQQEAYNQIQELKTYQTVTNITSDAHLEVTYKKDLQTQIDEVNQAIVALGGVI